MNVSAVAEKIYCSIFEEGPSRPGGTGIGQQDYKARKAKLRVGEEPCPEGHVNHSIPKGQSGVGGRKGRPQGCFRP